MIVHYPLRLSHIFSRDRLFDRAPRLLPGKVHAEASPARTADIRVHPHRAADSSGGPRDLWPHREVTQRLIYFTVETVSPSSSPPSRTLILPASLLTRGGPSSRHCAAYTSGQPSLHAATSYLHEKAVASFPLSLSGLTSSCPRET